MNRRARRALTAGVALSGAGALLALAYGWAAAFWKEDPVPTLIVQKERFVRRVTAEGNLRAVKATPLVAPPEANGPLKVAWLAPDGSYIKEGDVVVRFDPTDMQKKLEDGRAAHETAEKKIAKEGAMVGSALRNRDRTATLSEDELETTRAFRPRNELIFSRNQIIESEIDEGLSEAKKTHANQAKDIEKSLSQSKLALLAIERRAAELKVKQAQKGLTSMTIVAPHAGIVVFKRDWRGNELRVGDTVWNGQSLAEIPLLDAMEAEVFVLEADAGGLEVGRSATVVLEAHPETEYKATIKRVDTLAKPRVRDVPVQYFGVVLELERTDPAIMKPGQRVRATLVLEDREAVVVPRQVVFEKDGKNVVFRLARGKSAVAASFEAVAVELGQSSPGRVVIEEGLEPGDAIALRDPTRPLARDSGRGGEAAEDSQGSAPGGAP